MVYHIIVQKYTLVRSVVRRSKNIRIVLKINHTLNLFLNFKTEIFFYNKSING
jgi:hypothetical protein